MTKLQKLLENNCHVVLYDEEGERKYCIISPFKDEEGDYRLSGWYSTIKEAKQNISRFYGISLDRYNPYKIVEVFRNTTPPLKVGDKVRILDSIKETKDWDKYKDDFPNMKGEIIEVDNNITGLMYFIKDKDCDWYINADYIIPDYEEEIEELTLKQVCEELGREIKIVK